MMQPTQRRGAGFSGIMAARQPQAPPPQAAGLSQQLAGVPTAGPGQLYPGALSPGVQSIVDQFVQLPGEDPRNFTLGIPGMDGSVQINYDDPAGTAQRVKEAANIPGTYGNPIDISVGFGQSLPPGAIGTAQGQIPHDVQTPGFGTVTGAPPSLSDQLAQLSATAQEAYRDAKIQQVKREEAEKLARLQRNELKNADIAQREAERDQFGTRGRRQLSVMRAESIMRDYNRNPDKKISRRRQREVQDAANLLNQVAQQDQAAGRIAYSQAQDKIHREAANQLPADIDPRQAAINAELENQAKVVEQEAAAAKSRRSEERAIASSERAETNFRQSQEDKKRSRRERRLEKSFNKENLELRKLGFEVDRKTGDVYALDPETKERLGVVTGSDVQDAGVAGTRFKKAKDLVYQMQTGERPRRRDNVTPRTPEQVEAQSGGGNTGPTLSADAIRVISTGEGKRIQIRDRETGEMIDAVQMPDGRVVR